MSAAGALKTAAVFATMNRVATAVACVRALASQTRPPDLVIVADNVSTDGTTSALESMDGLPFPLIVHRMAENRGNAGGVEEAMELAFARGADSVWILDDDSIPQKDALRALLSVDLQPSVVRHAMQIDPMSGRLTWPMWVWFRNDWSLVGELGNLAGRDWIKTRASWTGALISREVREAVGPVRGELFIRGEDEEYPWRMECAGFAHAAVHTAILDHPGPQNLEMMRFFGKLLFFEKGLPDWKLHYKIRNMVWLKRRQSGGLKAILTALAYAIAAVRYDGSSRLALVGKASLEGWRGKLGRIS